MLAPHSRRPGVAGRRSVLGDAPRFTLRAMWRRPAHRAPSTPRGAPLGGASPHHRRSRPAAASGNGANGSGGGSGPGSNGGGGGGAGAGGSGSGADSGPDVLALLLGAATLLVALPSAWLLSAGGGGGGGAGVGPAAAAGGGGSAWVEDASAAAAPGTGGPATT